MDEKEIANMTEEEKEEKRKSLMEEIVLSTIEDFNKNLDKIKENHRMPDCMTALGYATYFINRNLYSEKVTNLWKNLQKKAIDIGKEIEEYNQQQIINSIKNEKGEQKR